MRLGTLKLHNFRNYADEVFSFGPGVNLICGQNAQGKTNLLEAVSALSTMRLFRTGQKRDGLRFGEDAAAVEGEFTAQGREFTLQLRLYRQKTMEIYRNGVRIRRQADAAGLLQTVLFCPDDLYLVREGAAARRRFLDTALCQLRPRYAQLLEEYNRLLDHKTRILRDSEEKPALLDLLDDFSLRMAQLGAQLIRRRAHFVRALADKARDIHAEISGGREALSVSYRTVSGVPDPFVPAAVLAAQLYTHALSHRVAEIGARSCLSGPHKDDLLLSIDGRPAAAFGSQGQVRTCALALKLAERDLFAEDTGEPPLLLLDDVLSELDRGRQDFVLNRIGGGQVLITCCEEELVERIRGGEVFRIRDGKRL
ncbi:MAG: DNA replication/repair protein RecF [Intestinibacillus sp.]